MKSIAILSLALLALAVMPSAADFCKGAPTPGYEGDPCNENPFNDDDFPCAQHLFCSQEAVCTLRLKEDVDCDPDYSPCETGYSCRGPEDKEKCVKNAGPGRSCSTTAASVATCGSGLSCQLPVTGSANVCLGGKLGDQCQSNSDCLSGLCTDKVCSGNDNGFACTASSQCKQGSYCREATACTPYAGEGAFCDNSNPCEYPLICANIVPSQTTFNNGTCVKPLTLEVGDYARLISGGTLGSFSSGFTCRDSMFVNPVFQTCSAQRPTYCSSDTNCAADSSCFCGETNDIGHGTCGGMKCLNSFKAAMDCLNEHCRLDEQISIGVTGGLTYTESCGFINCKDQLMAAKECSPAALLRVTFVTLLAALFVAFWNSN